MERFLVYTTFQAQTSLSQITIQRYLGDNFSVELFDKTLSCQQLPNGEMTGLGTGAKVGISIYLHDVYIYIYIYTYI
jgi:hypothetical protein